MTAAALLLAAVTLVRTDGSTADYVPAQPNDQARGVALIQAVTEALAGDVVMLSPGRFDIGGSRLDLWRASVDGVHLRGLHSTIRGHFAYASTGKTMIHPGGGSVVEGVNIVAEGSAVCWGAGWGEPPAYGAVLRDVSCASAATGLTIAASGTTAQLYDVTVRSPSMGVYVYAQNVDLDVWDSLIDVDCGPTGTSAVGAYFGGVGSETYLYGTRVEATCNQQPPPPCAGCPSPYPAARGVYVGAGDATTEVWLIGSAVETHSTITAPGAMVDLWQYGTPRLWITGSAFDTKKVKAKIICSKCEGGY